MSQYKVTHDEALIIASALDDWRPQFINDYDDRIKARRAVNTIDELARRMRNQSVDGRRIGRRSVVSLTTTIERLHYNYFIGSSW